MSTAARNILPFGTLAHRGPIRVLFADETTLVRAGLASICQSHLPCPCEVVAQCGDGVAALQMLREFRPDVAFLDWGLPELLTLEVIRQAQSSGIPTKIAVLFSRADRKMVLEAFRAGASAFLLKSGSSSQIEEALERLLKGGVYVSPGLKIDAISLTGQDTQFVPEPFDTLSPREFQVFSMLVEGIRAKEIAARLGLSPKTVDTYRSSLMTKLEIFDVAGLVKFQIHRSSLSAR